MSPAAARRTLLDVADPVLQEFFEAQNQPLYRLRQALEWMFQRQAMSFSEMSNLPRALRESLERHFRLHALRLRRQERSVVDGTIRFHFQGHDEADISAVFLPEKDRVSLCLSSQVGCAYRCGFCASGRVPFRRQLSAAEIVDQVLLMGREAGRRPDNLLFMGMGEPLANYAQVVKAIRWITSPAGLRMSPSRVTLSTSGLVPQVLKLAEERLGVGLALSLHAVRDDIRHRLMPVSGRYGVRELIKAGRTYALRTHAPVTLEYILIRRVNDFELDANRLAYLARGFPNKINLIAYNPVPGLPFERPEPFAVLRFQNWLRARGVSVFIRKPRGLDIGSACGQLGAV